MIAAGVAPLLTLAVVFGGAGGQPDRPVWDNSALAGRAVAPGPYDVEAVFAGVEFHTPVAMRAVPAGREEGGPRRLMIAELRGQVRTLTYAEAQPRQDVMFDMELGDPAESPNVWGWRGQFYAAEFDAAYPERPFIYICYNVATDAGRVNRLSRLRVTQQEPPEADVSSERVLLEWRSSGHNGADLHFGPDGMLYVSSGDGASPRDPENIGQSVDNLLGSVLRIDVDVPEEDEQGYRVPEDNPFVGLEGVRPEIWAYGLRNPWRMSFDVEGRLWLGDVGEEAWEMIYLIERGANYGWSAYEGNHPFRSGNPLAGPTPQRTAPVFEHPHTEARSISGGLVYAGEKHGDLRGHYVYGDYVTRRIWALGWDARAGRASEHRLLSNSGVQVLAFGEDHAGELYVLAEEGIFRLRRREAVEPGEPFPQRLSETGLFASTAAHEPAPGVVRYEVNAPAWRDGARGDRLLAMPAGGRFEPDQQRQWNLPEGGAAAMTLSIPVPDASAEDGRRWRRIETRVIHRDQGVWHFHTYRWDAEERDAQLVKSEGESARYAVVDADADEPRELGWRFQSAAECATCHVREAGLTLGLNAEQLNREGGEGRNQLERFHGWGLLFVDGGAPESLPRLVDPADEGAPLERRARAYLAANCAHCHREGGVAGRAPFDARPELALEAMRLVGVAAEAPVHTGSGGRLVEPGSPEDSELWRRAAAPLIGRMPPLGSSTVDEEGVELLRRWIRELADDGG